MKAMDMRTGMIFDTIETPKGVKYIAHTEKEAVAPKGSVALELADCKTTPSEICVVMESGKPSYELRVNK